MKVPISCPWVYLIDFETAVQFPAVCPSIERVLVGLPVAGAETYARSHAPEFASGEAYCPFKLDDIWQLGSSFSGFKVWQYIYTLLFFCLLIAFRFQSTIPEIDDILVSMTDIDPVHRLDAKEVKDRLGTIVNSMAPESLLIRPKTLRDRHG